MPLIEFEGCDRAQRSRSDIRSVLLSLTAEQVCDRLSLEVGKPVTDWSLVVCRLFEVETGHMEVSNMMLCQLRCSATLGSAFRVDNEEGNR